MKHILHSSVIAAILVIVGLRVNAQWLQTSLDSNYIFSFAIKGDTIFAGSEKNGIYLSKNNGGTWDTVNTGLNYMNGVYGMAIKGDTLFAGADGDGMNISSNFGGNWTAVNTGLTTTYVVSLVLKDSNIFVGTQDDESGHGGVFLSSNNGNNWVMLNNGLPSDLYTGYYYDIRALAIKGDTVFAGTNGGGLYFSTNNGTNWTAVDSSFGLDGIFAIAIKGSYIFVGTASCIYISSNNGSSWVATSSSAIREIYAFALNGNNIFAGSYDNGVFLSTNNGSSWTAVNTGLTSTDVCSLGINGSYLFTGVGNGLIGGGKGVWKRPLSELTGTPDMDNYESNISIYPNPATDNLIIETGDLQSTIYELRINDIVGNTVLEKTLYNKISSIDVSTLAKGMYFVKVKTDGGVAVKKFIKE